MAKKKPSQRLHEVAIMENVELIEKVATEMAAELRALNEKPSPLELVRRALNQNISK